MFSLEMQTLQINAIFQMHCHFRLIIDGFLKWSTFIIAMILNKLFSKAFVIPTNQDFKNQHPSWGLCYHTVCGTCVSFSLLYRNLIQSICEGDMFIWVHSFAGLQSKIGKSLLVQSLVVMLLAKASPGEREHVCLWVLLESRGNVTTGVHPDNPVQSEHLPKASSRDSITGWSSHPVAP